MSAAAAKLALMEAAEAAAKKASKAAAEEAAQAAAKKAAAAAAVTATKKAAAEAAQAAAKKAAAEAGQIAAKKSAAAAAATAAKEAAQSSLKKVSSTLDTGLSKLFKSSTKVADDGAEAAARVTKQSSAAFDDVAESAGKVAGKQTDDVAKEVGESFLKKNSGLIIGGISAATIAGAAAVSFKARNEKTLTITKIEIVDGGFFGGAGTSAKITYTPALKILKTDKLDIAGTDSEPQVYGFFMPVLSVISDTQVTVAGALTKAGTMGTITTHTSIQGQIADKIISAGGAVVGAGANIAGGVVNEGLSAAGLPTINNLGAKLASYKYWLLACLCLYFVVKLWLGSRRR